MKNSFLVVLSTLGPCGYIAGSGTLATALTLPVVWWLAQCDLSHGAYLVIVAISFLVALLCINRALGVFRREKDPSQIVLDEVVGTLVVFVARSVTVHSLIIGFLLFRLFDIFKPFGIRKIELFPGAWGIMLDDIAAALLANCGLWLLGW